MTEVDIIPRRILATKRVHIVDARPNMCEMLSVLFRLEGFQTVFSLDAEHFLASVAHTPPDVVVLCLHLEGDTSLALLRRVKLDFPGIVVIGVGQPADFETAIVAMKRGASDIVCEPVDGEYLLSVVRQALSRDIQIGLVNGRRQVEVRGFAQLTDREREVLTLITNGKSNKKAADELGISHRTIEVHRSRVMQKLGARNTADLMRIVLTD
jgi:two-component system, LuxR family, response regulator FixJ